MERTVELDLSRVTRFTLKKIRDRNLFSFDVRYVSVTGRRVTQDLSIHWQYAWLCDLVQKKLQKCAKLCSSSKEYRIEEIFLLNLTRETSLCLLEKLCYVCREFWKYCYEKLFFYSGQRDKSQIVTLCIYIWLFYLTYSEISFKKRIMKTIFL